MSLPAELDQIAAAVARKLATLPAVDANGTPIHPNGAQQS